MGTSRRVSLVLVAALMLYYGRAQDYISVGSPPIQLALQPLAAKRLAYSA